MVASYLGDRSSKAVPKGGVSDYGGACPDCPMCRRCGGSINLQPRPKAPRGGELARPMRAESSRDFFGAGVSGGRAPGGTNPWVAHVKRVAADRGISYTQALTVAGQSYKRGGAFMGTMSDPMGDLAL